MTTPEPTPEKIIVTPEMRQAVYEDDCARIGHAIAISELLVAPNVNDSANVLITATDEDTLPHIFCARCGKVWLLVEEPEPDYETAETKLQERLKPTTELSKKITQRRNRRKARKLREMQQQESEEHVHDDHEHTH